MTAIESDLYSTVEACRVAGLTYRNCDYWCRMDAVRPAVEAAGSGSHRVWTVEQVAALTAIAQVQRDLAELDVMMPVSLVRRLWTELMRDGHGLVTMSTVTIEVERDDLVGA